MDLTVFLKEKNSVEVYPTEKDMDDHRLPKKYSGLSTVNESNYFKEQDRESNILRLQVREQVNDLQEEQSPPYKTARQDKAMFENNCVESRLEENPRPRDERRSLPG